MGYFTGVGKRGDRSTANKSRSEYFIAVILPTFAIFLPRLRTFCFNEMLLSTVVSFRLLRNACFSTSSTDFLHNSVCALSLIPFPLGVSSSGSKVGRIEATYIIAIAKFRASFAFTVQRSKRFRASRFAQRETKSRSDDSIRLASKSGTEKS